jgi:hypothetical protein
LGKELAPNEYYSLDPTEFTKWKLSTEVQNSISSGDLVVNNNITDLSPTNGWYWLGNYNSPSELVYTAAITTNSTSDVLMANMTFTMAAGIYLVSFYGSFSATNSNKTVYISAYKNGVQVNGTEMPNKFASTATTQTSTISKPVVFVDNDTLEIRWRVSGNSATCYNRTLTIVYLGSEI